jgi:hypothetical protein
MRFGISLKAFFSLSAMCLAKLAYAATTASALVYMIPDVYINQTQVGGDENGVWINTGDVVAPIAVEAFGGLFGNVGVCQGAMTSDVLIWLKPTMDYNPMMTTFYGTIEADVFSGSGVYVSTYKEQAQQSGNIDTEPNSKINSTYRKAMQMVVQKMQSDSDFQARVAKISGGQTKLPCGMVGMQVPQPSVLDNVVDQLKEVVTGE